jgi:hypothetical protein
MFGSKPVYYVFWQWDGKGTAPAQPHFGWREFYNIEDVKRFINDPGPVSLVHRVFHGHEIKLKTIGPVPAHIEIVT